MRRKMKLKADAIAPLLYEGAGDLVLASILTAYCRHNGVPKNNLRLANKRFMSLMDDSSTCITWSPPSPRYEYSNEAYPESMPNNLSMIALAPGRWSNLTTINCSGNANFGSLVGIPGTIQFLNISGCYFVHSLAPLASCKLLKELDCSGTAVTHLSHLTTCTMLEILDISSCYHLSSECLEPLTGTLKCLREINCRGVPNGWDAHIVGSGPILDVTPLARFESLSKVHYNGPIADLSPLAAIPLLAVLDLSGYTEQLDQSPLSSCSLLKHLNLKGTEFTNLSSLRSCLSLSSVNLKETAATLQDITILASLPQMEKISVEFHQDMEADLDAEELMQFLVLTSPSVAGVIPKLLKAIFYPYDAIAGKELQDELSDLLSDIILSGSSSRERITLAVNTYFVLSDNLDSSEHNLFKIFFPQCIFMRLVQILQSPGTGDVTQIQIIQILSSLDTEQFLRVDDGVHLLDTALAFEGDLQPGHPCIVPLLVRFISPDNAESLRIAAAGVLARVSAAYDVCFDYDYEDDEELREEMNTVRSFILSQPGVLDFLMDMLKTGDSKMEYRAFKVLQNVAGDHDYASDKVWRTDVTCYHETAASIASHPGLLPLLYNMLDRDCAEKTRSYDGDVAYLLGVLASHDKVFAEELVEKMRQLLLKGPHSEVSGVIFKLDCQKMVSWITQLLHSRLQEDHELAQGLLQELGGQVKQVMESEIPRLLVSLLQKKKFYDSALAPIKALNSILMADRLNHPDIPIVLAALPGDLISLLVASTESKNDEVKGEAVSALRHLAEHKSTRARIFEAKQPKSRTSLVRVLASSLDSIKPVQKDEVRDVVEDSLYLLGLLAEGDKKRTSFIGNIPHLLDSLITQSSGGCLALLKQLAEDPKLALKISCYNFLMRLSDMVLNNEQRRRAIDLFYALSKVEDCRKVVWEWISMYLLTSQYGLSSCLERVCDFEKVLVAKILAELAGNSKLKSEIKISEAIGLLTSYKSSVGGEGNGELKRAATAALAKIRSRS